MGKLIEVLQKLILFLMYPSAEERTRHLELRKIYQELRYLKLSYTDISGKHIQPEFADKVFQLYDLMQTLRKTLKLPRHRGELLKMSDLLEYIVVQELDRNTQKQIEGINPENFQRLLRASSNQEQTLMDFEALWRNISHQISELHETRLNQDLFQIEVLYALIEYDFDLLLRKFNPLYQPSRKGERSQFKECPKEELEQELLDLYFIVGALRIDQRLRRLVEQLYAYFNDRGEESEHRPEGLGELLDKAELIFENELSAGTLSTVFKLMHQDPEFESEKMKIEGDYVDDVWNIIRYRYQTSVALIHRTILDEQSLQKMDRFFSGESLLELSSYNRESDTLFESAGMHGYLFILPLKLIKTYQRQFLERRLLNPLLKINHEGIFTEGEVKTSFQSAIEEVSEISAAMREFESSISRNNVAAVAGMIDGNGPSEKRGVKLEELEQHRDTVDGEALQLMEYSKKALEKLNHSMRIIIEEYHSLHPQIVANIKVIGGNMSGEMRGFLEEAQQVHSALVDVLDSYLQSDFKPVA